MSSATRSQDRLQSHDRAQSQSRQPPAGQGGRGPGRQGTPTAKPQRFGPSARRLFGLLRPQRWRLLVVVLSGVVGVVFAVIGPKLLGNATTLIFAGVISKRLPAGLTRGQVVAQLEHAGHGGQADLLRNMPLHPGQGIDFTALNQLLALIAALYLLSSLFNWVSGYVLNTAVVVTVQRMREDLERKVHRLPLSYFDRVPRGDLLSRLTNDIDNVQQTLQQTFSQMISSVLTVIGVLVMMFVVSPLLAGISLIAIPLTLLVTAVIGKRSQKLFVDQWARTGQVNAIVEEAYTGNDLVKLYGRQAATLAEFDAANEQLYRSSFGAQFVSGIIMPTMTFVGNLVYVLIAVIGGLQVAAGVMQIGDVQAFIQYSRQFTQPLSQLGSMANLLQSGVASAERVFEVMDVEDESADPEDAPHPADAGGRLRFEHVSFGYQPGEPLIHDLSLMVSPGETVAIVGPTGAGKTTLVNLIMRFYELDSGRILLDDVDIAHLQRDDLRGQIGMVLQDAWLFSGTIRENIAYGRPSATEDEIVEAARATSVDAFVRRLPEGYDTMVAEDGGVLSQGERQLVTIARAFLAHRSVLILDEATSSVDTRTEHLVQQAMATLREGRTSFVIAHRLSTIRDADQILVMEHGDIVEHGAHAELLARQGAYARLYQAQFQAGGAVDDLDEAD
jgi:ATP-binding cassette subfamily B protein